MDKCICCRERVASGALMFCERCSKAWNRWHDSKSDDGTMAATMKWVANRAWRFASKRHDVLSVGDVAKLLGVKSPNTVKNWLEGGSFPGAWQTAGGHWRFLREDVERVRVRLAELAARNNAGGMNLPDLADDAELPLL